MTVSALGSRRSVAALTAAACVALVSATEGSGQVAEHAGRLADGDVTTYQLADTWEGVAWKARPGHLRDPKDLTSSPDGRLFVLDRISNRGALHIYGDGLGEPTLVQLDTRATQIRLDAHLDGTVYTVGSARTNIGAPVGFRRYIVERYGPDGSKLSEFNVDIPEFSAVSDIAVSPTGLVLLSRMPSLRDERASPAAIDVYDSSGDRVSVIESTGYYTTDHDAPRHVHLTIRRLDVEPNGTLIAIIGFVGCT